MEASRVIVVGLDGASWDVLDPLMARGLMPNLARLVSSGARGPLASTWPGWTPPGWTSIATGLNPGRHGILYATNAVPGEYPGAVPGGVPGTAISALDVRGAPLWRVLTAAGRRSCVLLVPLTYPPEEIAGTLVAGMFRPRDAVDYVHPPAPTPAEAWPFDPEMILRGGDARTDDPVEVARSLREITEHNAEAFAEELSREPWDLFFAAFMAPDRAAHYFWDRLVALGAAGDDGVDRDLAAVFRSIDGFLGTALEEAERGAAVVVVSDHGSGSAALERVNLIRALEEARLARVVRTGWRRRPALPTRFDWSRTRIFPLFMGDLYVVGLAANERGRWPGGIVDPADAPEALEGAEAAMRALRDPAGREVVRAVRRGRDVYRGPFAARYPDLLVELDPRFMAGGSPRGPRFEPHRDPATGWGSHRQDGILALSGPGVRPGDVTGARVEDVAPTVLRLLGLHFADPVDGRALEEVLEPGATTAAPSVPPTRGGEPVRDRGGDDREIEAMLRGLGYIE